MDDTTNQGMSNLSSTPTADPSKPMDPIVPGGPTVSLSQEPNVAQPVATPSEPAFGVAPAVTESQPKDDGDIKTSLKRIEDKLAAIALKIGA